MAFQHHHDVIDRTLAEVAYLARYESLTRSYAASSAKGSGREFLALTDACLELLHLASLVAENPSALADEMRAHPRLGKLFS